MEFACGETLFYGCEDTIFCILFINDVHSVGTLWPTNLIIPNSNS